MRALRIQSNEVFKCMDASFKVKLLVSKFDEAQKV